MDNTKNKKPNKSNKSKKRKVLDGFIIFMLTLVLLGGITVFFVLGRMVFGIDTQKDIVDKVKSRESSSIIQVDTGEKIGDWGGETRENIKYSQLPQSTIDAFLSIEDSRYFKHNGFDLPRFISSMMTNVRTGDLAQGGSTLTMQAIDNFITKKKEEADDKAGKSQNSLDRVESKIKEIYMSMKLEGEMSKEEILIEYLNQINFGGQTRGIQKGAQYYFGKNVEQLSLSESAFLAGVINAPNNNNPYTGKQDGVDFYARAMKRRNETLYQMHNHGYISDKEYALAKSTELAFQIVGTEKFEVDPYYSYFQMAATEAFKLTGDDPATTPMNIYVSMNKDAQVEASKIQKGEIISIPKNDYGFEGSYEKYYQYGSVTMNNQTGEVVAICQGRNNTTNNRATKDLHQTGSAIKPILDYVLTFDKLGWATSHTLDDHAFSITDDANMLQNSNRRYQGEVQLNKAIGESLNTTAILALKDLINKIGVKEVVNYLHEVGFTNVETENFSLGYGIGGSGMEATPLQMAAAYAPFANGGYYIEPHTIVKIEYKDSSEVIEPEYEKQQVFSEGAAYMMSDLLYSAVNGGWANLLGEMRFGGVPVYGKSGTSDWDEHAESYGIPNGSMRDEWMIGYTNEYVVATWSGFDGAIKGEQSWINENLLYANNPGKINKHMLQTVSNKPARLKRPADVTEISHVKGVYPYVKAPTGANNAVTGLIQTKFAKIGEMDVIPPLDLANFTVTQATTEGSSLVFTFSGYPAAEGDKMLEMFGPIQYRVEITIDGQVIKSLSFNEPSGADDGSIPNGKSATVCGFYEYAKNPVRSNQKCTTVKVDAAVDKTLLNDMIGKAKLANAASYTPENFATLQNTLAEALNIYNNPVSTQLQVNTVYNLLKQIVETAI